MNAEFISASSITRFQQPFRELLGGADHPLLPALSSRFGYDDRLGLLSNRPGVPESIAADLEDHNRRMGAGEEIIEKMRYVLEGAGGIVVTGQQPGLFGGPLLTLYKGLTAVALARRLEERFAVPVVPVFWNAVNDDDFAEVRSCTLVTPEPKLVTIEVPARYHESGMCVGSIPVGDLSGLLDAARGFLEQWGGNGREAFRLLAQAFESEYWGEHFARILVRLLGGRILVFNAGSSAWVCEGVNIARAFAADRQKALESLRERARRMKSIDMPATIPEGTLGIPLTLIEDGRRRRFSAWDEATIARLIEERACDLYPNVALRSIYQDALLPVLAHVVGPGEVHYLAQLSPLYEALGVPEPVRVPRMTLTLLPPAVSSVSAALDKSRSDVYLDWALSRRQYVASLMPDGYCEAVEELASLVSRDGSELIRRIDGGAQLQKEINRISELVSGLKSKAEELLVQRSKQEGLDLSLVSDFLHPRGALQERMLSLLVPLCAGGFEFVTGLLSLADEHLERLEGSGSGHFVVDLQS